MNPTNGKICADCILSLFSNIYAGRHGNAPKVEGVADNDRQLGEKGLAQAADAAKRFEPMFVDLVFASALPRAQQTASIVTGAPRDKIIILESYTIGEDPKDPLNVMFSELVYSPLSEYFKHELAEHLKEYGRRLLAELVEKTEAAGLEKASVFVGGHAVTHPALVWAIGEVLANEGVPFGEQLKEAMLEINLGEAQIVAVSFVDNDATVSVI